MRELVKKVIRHCPTFLKKGLLSLYEYKVRLEYGKKETDHYGKLPDNKSTGLIKNILIYHISGLSFGGTEKNLQSIANGLCKEYNVFFMYSSKETTQTRISHINKEVVLIPFDYEKREKSFPYFIYGMKEHIKNIVTEKNIDLIITAGSGHGEYPINTIKNTPIIMINIFGSPCVQKNIKKHIFISKAIQDYSEKYTGPSNKNISLCIPVPSPSINLDKIKKIKKYINYKENDFVFGRIGRASNEIFDSIGIFAFEIITKKYPNAKYLIMSPPSVLKKIVEDKKIPNVFFLDPSGEEEDVWAFHKTIDSLAHFRYDGETFGLNIAESMTLGNPIISHKSKIWNAHTNYLTKNFSRVADINDVESYAKYMEEFILIKKHNKKRWKQMRVAAETYAKENFSENIYLSSLRKIIQELERQNIK